MQRMNENRSLEDKPLGDLFTVRMHWGSVASSERMIVSPGQESAGMMHMPTGQSVMSASLPGSMEPTRWLMPCVMAGLMVSLAR